MRTIVIGAGVVGMTTAYYLQQKGHEVTVLEAEAEAARGASYGNGGYLQASVTDPFNGPGVLKIFAQAWFNGLMGRGDDSAFYTRTSALPGLVFWGLKFLKNSNLNTFLSHTVKNMHLARYSRDLTKRIAEEESMSFSQSGKGALIVYRDQQAMDGYVSVVKHVAEHGISYEVLDRAAMLQREPSLTGIADKLSGAVYLPDDYAANSYLFCQQLTDILINRGVNFQFNASVQKIIDGNNQSKKKLRVVSHNNEYVADNVVIAAGNHSKHLARALGIKLPISPIKGYSISIPMGDWQNRPSQPIIDMALHAGVNPLGNVLRVAGTAEIAGLKPGISKRRIDYLIGLAAHLYPDFAATIDRQNIDPWGGHRPISADGLPMIGATKVKGVYINSGHGGMGWSQAAGSSKALVDLISGDQADISMADFSVARFN